MIDLGFGLVLNLTAKMKNLNLTAKNPPTPFDVFCVRSV